MIRTVGFIGLGDIGEPMARNLCAGDFEVVVFDLRNEMVDLLVESGAKAAGSCREVGERCEVVCVCVMDDAATEAVIAGQDGVLAGARAETIIAIHSTVNPATVKKLAERASGNGVHVVDAQMTGGRAATEAKQLRYMVGGDDAILDRLTPVLEASAGEITRCGALGMGAVAKLCNNLVQFVAWQGYVEADGLAAEAGLSREVFNEVLSWMMNDNARAMLAGRTALHADPDHAFLKDRFTQVMLLAEKDMTLALQVARENGVSMPVAGLSTQQLARMFAVPDPKRR
jgi:3-hydroxyisobutyrate dehydrogenase